MTGQEIKNTDKNKSRLYSIEFIRIILTFSVIAVHFFQVFAYHNNTFEISSKVDMFLVLGGFFLFENIKKHNNNSNDTKDFIRKLYLRLAPAFFSAVIIIALIQHVDFYGFISRILYAITFNTGMALPGQINGWGDYYVGIYFWVSIFYFTLLTKFNREKSLLIIGILIYTGFVIFTHAERLHNSANMTAKALDGTFFNVIGVQFVRGIISVGIGIFISNISQYIQFSKSKKAFVLFSVIEIALLLYLRHNKILISSMIGFGILLLMCINSAGLISRCLNKCKWVQYISRYSYSVFITHAIIIYLIRVGAKIGLAPALISSCVLGVIIYHLIERPIQKKFNNIGGTAISIKD